jgi:hypothetical protein
LTKLDAVRKEKRKKKKGKRKKEKYFSIIFLIEK